MTVDVVRSIMRMWPQRTAASGPGTGTGTGGGAAATASTGTGTEMELDLGEFKGFVGRVAKQHPDLEPALGDPLFAECLFNLFDSDHNGRISAKEFFGGLGVMARCDKQEKATLLFHACDQNGDGMVTIAEMKETMKRTISSARTMIQAQVKYHLTAQTGSVFGSSYICNLVSRMMALDEERNAVSIFESDVNRDGTLSLQEWLTNYQSNAALQRFFEFATGEVVVPGDKLKGMDTDELVKVLASQFPALSPETHLHLAVTVKS
ncbi:hypothetical protein Pelo_10258 [Pelomyxa schiedti]|nr:hypothetical protein Pelo_10258 [Pelomyxa schiedti]